MSSGLPIRRTGVAAIVFSMSPRLPRFSAARSIGVSMKPGGTALTVMPFGPYSSAGVGARRGDVDDATPAGLEHVGQHRLDHVEDPIEVDVDQPLPIRELDVVETFEPVQAGGVDQNSDRAQLLTDG